MSADRRDRARRIVTGVALIGSLFIAGVPDTRTARATETVMWGSAVRLAPTNTITFDPQLAVNSAGQILAVWYSGPAPGGCFCGNFFATTTTTITRARDERAVRAGSGSAIVAAVGSIREGFRHPTVIAHDGSDGPGALHIGLSRSGIAYVAWEPARSPTWMIATAVNGHFAAPRALKLPHHGTLWRLAYGLDGPVDAYYYWHRASDGWATGYSCARLNPAGALSAAFRVAHHNHANPCRLPNTAGMHGPIPPSPPAPANADPRSGTILSRSDGHGHDTAIWQTWRNRADRSILASMTN
ncbi:MAG: hypothetical protein ACYDHH_26980 [Solirubrobacteraceae bacterium]